ncbi:hypothetical protein [Paenibacillus sp. FSL H8-0259]|uniref:hypothetical protein n=1 Tax=Paenibacillus sp. FSL H8-0259 TaxID=1920423 RepID=UPI00096C6C78|nr:hypothetical protein [Paenibacillus sp. FSL H8-0259]OMF30944.1 hypothetical protein BK132_05810 [Paenibacillus sp. FSL H8-0259]
MNELTSKWPELTITISGVFLGAILALWLAKWQLSRQAQEKLKEERITLEHKYDRVLTELRDNRNSIKILSEALGESSIDTTREEWEYMISIANSLSLYLYHDLINTSLNKLLPPKIDKELYNSYKYVQDLNHYVYKQAKLHFALRSISNPRTQLNIPYNNLCKFTNTVLDHLDYSVNQLDSANSNTN